MARKNREKILKIAVFSVVGLFLLDKFVITWGIASWKDRSARIEALEQKVTDGKKLIERANSLRGRWNDMQRNDLPDDEKRADNDVVNAMNRWRRDSRISSYNGYTQPRLVTHEDEGYEVLECGLTAIADQSTLARLLYELERDALASRVTKVEMNSKDADGKRLEMSLRFNFLRLAETKRSRR